GHRDLLRQAYGLVVRAQRRPQPRPVGEGALDPPQRLEEIERPGLARERVEQRYASCRVPIRGGHLLISPRLSDTSTSSVNVFIEASRPNSCSSTAASRNALAPANIVSSTVVRI